MRVALYVSAFLVMAVAAAHSYLGERYILIRLFRLENLPKLFGSTEFTVRTLRFAWHLTSVAWLGLAAILVLLANPAATLNTIGFVIVFKVMAVAAAHSYSGERYILIRLFRLENLPKLFGSTEFTVRTLRFAWHLTSVAWLGLAAILVLLANPAATLNTIGFVIGCIFLVHFVVAIVGSRGRHLSWPLFLAIGIITFYAVTI